VSGLVEFTYLGSRYRTNIDASVVEGLDGATWNRTCSLTVRRAALDAAGAFVEAA
jgi:hypothetical protein